MESVGVEGGIIEMGRRRSDSQLFSTVLEDSTTRRHYNSESRAWVWLKCGGVALATPLTHTILTLADMAFRIVKLATLSHFWLPSSMYISPEEKGTKEEAIYSFKARLGWVGQDLEKLVMRPLLLLGLELSAIYGLVNPYDGRKLCATFERLSMQIDPFEISLAPSFQPLTNISLKGFDSLEDDFVEDSSFELDPHWEMETL